MLVVKPASDEPEAHDQAIVMAIGEELTRVRQALGWSRPELLRRLPIEMPVNTYACYETGLRACPTFRLVDICRALGEDVGEFMNRALERIHDPSRKGLSCDGLVALLGAQPPGRRVVTLAHGGQYVPVERLRVVHYADGRVYSGGDKRPPGTEQAVVL